MEDMGATEDTGITKATRIVGMRSTMTLGVTASRTANCCCKAASDMPWVLKWFEVAVMVRSLGRRDGWVAFEWSFCSTEVVKLSYKRTGKYM